MARIRPRRRSPELEVHCFGVHGEGLRADRRLLFHGGHSLDRIWIGVRAPPRLLTNPVRRGAGWELLLDIRTAASDQAVPSYLAPGRRRRFHRVQLLLPRNRDRCADHDTDPGAVHGTDRGRGAPSPSSRRPAAVVPHVALPTTKPAGSRGLDFRLRYL